MWYARALPFATAVIVALAPLTAQAASSAQSEAKRRANIENDIARCQLAAEGVSLPGKVAPSEPEAAAECGAGARALTAVPVAVSGGSRCSAVGRPLTKFEQNQINEFEIAKSKAIKKNAPIPMPSADVAALLAC
jgi:hypothetical protein